MEYKPTVPVLIRLAKETASGMHYLSSQSQPLVHRDLAGNLFPASTLMNDSARNLLVDKKVLYISVVCEIDTET